MEYKSESIIHNKICKKNSSKKVEEQYTRIINENAANGWKLLGIHTVDIHERAGCISMCFGIFWVYYALDILIFFRE